MITFGASHSLTRQETPASPVKLRESIIRKFESDFGGLVDSVVSLLWNESFHFHEMQSVHRTQIRRELIFRQCMPYFATWRSVAYTRPIDVTALRAIVLCHTLALTHLDYHLDGAPPREGNAATAVKIVPEASVAYAVRCSLLAARHLAVHPAGVRLMGEVVEPISGFVIERMYTDFTERFAPLPRNGRQIEDAVNTYLTSEQSRLLGSGYWEVMVCSAAIAANPAEAIPDHLKRFAHHLRRLRQLVDELDDWHEDLEAGLLTLPTLIRMAHDTKFSASLRHSWDLRHTANICPIDSFVLEEMERRVAVEASLALRCLESAGASEYLAMLVSMKTAKASMLSAQFQN